MTTDGRWLEFVKARFTHTVRGVCKDRTDHAAGVAGNRSYLTNGGFKAKTVNYGDDLSRPAGSVPPQGRPPRGRRRRVPVGPLCSAIFPFFSPSTSRYRSRPSTRTKVNRQQSSAGLGDVPHRPCACGGDNQEQEWDYKGGSLAHMKYQTFRNDCYLALALLLLTLGAVSANAATVPISGSYEVIQKSGLGSQARVLVRFHLTNHGAGLLYLRRVLLSDFSHPPSGASLMQPIALPPGVTEETSREFSVPRLQLNQWQKGVLPRAVLELETSTGARTTLAIRLEHAPVRGGE